MDEKEFPIEPGMSKWVAMPEEYKKRFWEYEKVMARKNYNYDQWQKIIIKE